MPPCPIQKSLPSFMNPDSSDFLNPKPLYLKLKEYSTCMPPCPIQKSLPSFMNPDSSDFLNPKPLYPKLKSLIIKEHSTHTPPTCPIL